MGTAHMNGARYGALIRSRFALWRQKLFGPISGRLPLVQDHERCLWMAPNLEALRKAGFAVVEDFPKHSPDLNAIEGWWARLRQRLEDTAPDSFESRKQFVARMRRTVSWMAANWREDALHLATNQKERARAVLAADGGRTRW